MRHFTGPYLLHPFFFLSCESNSLSKKRLIECFFALV
jgi:hypothetical protein